MSHLIDCLTTTDALAAVFSDESVLQAMLDVEAALTRAAARAGAIPERAARIISELARAEHFEAVAIAREARQSATPVIPLVKVLTDRVRAVDPGSAQYVHWGATSQDVSDTAMVLLLRRARSTIAPDHARLESALRALSDMHATTPMLGRTLLQPATPITFGLKVAGWWAAADRAWQRLWSAWDAALVLQLGGAAGTRAGFGAHASTMVAEMSAELGLPSVPPWHADRDRLGALITASALYTAALAKVARDIVLLMQEEVGEVAETGGPSSAMPHKRNPSGSVLVIAAATRMPGLTTAFVSGMLQEHERSAGTGQSEWGTIASAVQATGSAANAMSAVLASLDVDTERMRLNLEATRGVVFAERAVMLLGARLGRDVAQRLVAEAIQRTRKTRQQFRDVLAGMPEVTRALSAEVCATIDRPEHYLGEAETLRKQLLDRSSVVRSEVDTKFP